MLEFPGLRKFAAAAIFLPLCATAALAHAKLVKESPAHNATVKPPAEISLKFNETIELGFSKIDVKDQTGTAVKGGALVNAAGDKTTLIMPLATPLAPGKYTVEWHVLTAGDGHKIKGSYSFTAAP